jgi:hypothetical protein
MRDRRSGEVALAVLVRFVAADEAAEGSSREDSRAGAESLTPIARVFEIAAEPKLLGASEVSR